MAFLPRFLLRLSRWLQARAILLEPEQTGLEEGARAVVAVALIVLLSHVSRYSELTWAAFGAFWTCLVDPGGPARARLRAMALFAASGAVAALLASHAGQMSGPSSTAVLMALVFLGGMFRLFGPRATQAGILASVVADVAIDCPGPWQRDAVLAGIFLSGCLWAVFVCLFLWRTHPFQPARRAVGALYRDLGLMCGELDLACADARRRFEGDAHRRAIRHAIERARALLDRLAVDHRDPPSRQRLLAAIEAGDRIFAGLVAVETDFSQLPSEIGRIRLSALLGEVSAALAAIGGQVLDPCPDGGPLRDLARRLAGFADTPRSFDACLAGVFSHSVAELGRCWSGAAADPDEAAEDTPRPADGAARGLVLRHAARLAVAVAVARLLTLRLGLPYGYWATVAVVVVMQPRIEENWPRLAERALGSLAGGLLAALLWVVLPDPGLILVAIFPLVAATIAFRGVNYTLFVLFLSALFVLVADLGAPANGEGVALARACNNMLGCLVSLAAGLLLWRDPPTVRFEQLLAAAVEANIDYVMQVLRGAEASPTAVDAARRRAGLCSNAAEIALRRRLLEGRRLAARRGRTEALLAELRGLTGAATAAWLGGERAEPDEHLSVWCRSLRTELVLAVQTGAGLAPGTMPGAGAGRIGRALTRVLAQANLYAAGAP